MHTQRTPLGFKQSACQQRAGLVRRGRLGFTLVELLVAITIFVILATLAITTVNLNNGSERVVTASRQVQAMLEGARSRAFRSRKPVGVRFLLDPNYPNEVVSMLYVTAPELPTGGTKISGQFRYIGSATDPRVKQVGSPGLTWMQMNQAGVLGPGATFQQLSPRQSFAVSTVNFLVSPPGLTPENPNVMRLVELPEGASFGALNSPDDPSTFLNYEIDLSTSLMAYSPAAGDDPVTLPQGVVIDLRGDVSVTPRTWQYGAWIPEYGYRAGSWIVADGRAYRADNSGTTGTSAPDWSSATLPRQTVTDNNSVRWRCFTTPQLDVIFTPQGTVMGDVSAEGVLHLVISETRDTRAVLDDGTVGIKPWDMSDHSVPPNGRPNHLGTYRVVSVFPASGNVNVSQIDQTDVRNNTSGDPGADGIADDLFRLAIQGATSR